MNSKDKRPYFRHFVVELSCSFKKANSLIWIKKRVGLLIEKLEIRTLKNTEYLFKPQGITLIYIISSSHLAVHTWPENNYIHIELLTCSKNRKVDNFNLILEEVFPNLQYKLQELTY